MPARVKAPLLPSRPWLVAAGSAVPRLAGRTAATQSAPSQDIEDAKLPIFIRRLHVALNQTVSFCPFDSGLRPFAEGSELNAMDLIFRSHEISFDRISH